MAETLAGLMTDCLTGTFGHPFGSPRPQTERKVKFRQMCVRNCDGNSK